jgi:hypothetical protein
MVRRYTTVVAGANQQLPEQQPNAAAVQVAAVIVMQRCAM